MRVDKFLKVSRIIKRRTIANEACDAGRVMINGKVVKAGAEVKIGDTWYIFDSEMQDAKNKDYYWKTYSNYPTKPLIKEKEWEVNF